MGNEYLYQMLAKDTIETLDRYEVKTIVTSCPHCFHQIGNEFPQLGGNYEVIHHSTYIERLLAGGPRAAATRTRASASRSRITTRCYLGRYNDVYDAPRETLRRALPVVDLVEPERTTDRGLCCGAGGGRMCMEETQGKRINVERTEELLATGADTIAVACPFCMTMISDGVKAKQSRRAGARHRRGRRLAAAEIGGGAAERERSRNDRKHLARGAAQGRAGGLRTNPRQGRRRESDRQHEGPRWRMAMIGRAEADGRLKAGRHGRRVHGRKHRRVARAGLRGEGLSSSHRHLHRVQRGEARRRWRRSAPS